MLIVPISDCNKESCTIHFYCSGMERFVKKDGITPYETK